MSRRGKFITLEGLDGTGKSTQMRKLAAVLREGGHKVVETREPGGTPTAEKIRKVLLDSGTAGLAPNAEMALMFAARAQHIAEVIEPGLASGAVVLCDRFTDSTEAYQGSGRRLGSEPVRELHRVLCGNLQPDLTILMDSNPHSSVSRARRRNKRDSRVPRVATTKTDLSRKPGHSSDACTMDTWRLPNANPDASSSWMPAELRGRRMSGSSTSFNEDSRFRLDRLAGVMDFRRLQWLFPIAVALHNAEEAIWMPAWDVGRLEDVVGRPPGATEIRAALVVLTVAAFAVTYLSARRGPKTIWAYLTFGYISAMLANVFVPHVPVAILLRGYAPGAVTAVLINLPVMSILAIRMVRERWVSGWKAAGFGWEFRS
jgi:dTMP kinase